jgi:hypothetical protein
MSTPVPNGPIDQRLTDKDMLDEGVPTDETLPAGHPSDPNATDTGEDDES